MVCAIVQGRTQTYHDIGLAQLPADLRVNAEVPLEHIDIQVTLQAPHCPSALRLPELKACTMGRDRQEFEAVTAVSRMNQNGDMCGSPLTARLERYLHHAVANTASKIHTEDQQ